MNMLPDVAMNPHDESENSQYQAAGGQEAQDRGKISKFQLFFIFLNLFASFILFLIGLYGVSIVKAADNIGPGPLTTAFNLCLYSIAIIAVSVESCLSPSYEYSSNLAALFISLCGALNWTEYMLTGVYFVFTTCPHYDSASEHCDSYYAFSTIVILIGFTYLLSTGYHFIRLFSIHSLGINGLKGRVSLLGGLLLIIAFIFKTVAWSILFSTSYVRSANYVDYYYGFYPVFTIVILFTYSIYYFGFNNQNNNNGHGPLFIDQVNEKKISLFIGISSFFSFFSYAVIYLIYASRALNWNLVDNKDKLHFTAVVLIIFATIILSVYHLINSRTNNNQNAQFQNMNDSSSSFSIISKALYIFLGVAVTISIILVAKIEDPDGVPYSPYYPYFPRFYFSYPSDAVSILIFNGIMIPLVYFVNFRAETETAGSQESFLSFIISFMITLFWFMYVLSSNASTFNHCTDYSCGLVAFSVMTVTSIFFLSVNSFFAYRYRLQLERTNTPQNETKRTNRILPIIALFLIAGEIIWAVTLSYVSVYHGVNYSPFVAGGNTAEYFPWVIIMPLHLLIMAFYSLLSCASSDRVCGEGLTPKFSIISIRSAGFLLSIISIATTAYMFQTGSFSGGSIIATTYSYTSGSPAEKNALSSGCLIESFFIIIATIMTMFFSFKA